MDEVRLSRRELRALAEIEQALSADVALERGLRDPRRKGAHAQGPPRRSAVVAGVLLGILSLALLTLAVVTGEPALIWAFATVWVITLSCLLRLVVRWSRQLKPQSWPL
ncbi:DUF3040 domain-containing protein [Streptomyces sp. Je 1-79]|uniref:DUF3040 domain-containing protein n=1 Tax=Streptomyces sp. Je 1-79 TaxID=2943847 RepID=UPI0021A671F5|nr:DUF3040 domain-containing protein [Streptomyces sp. Je 1-79]MCT4357001.1 DUF3040 domain-containing protein [Streptomyces sp. Je 1-79]